MFEFLYVFNLHDMLFTPSLLVERSIIYNGISANQIYIAVN